MKWAIAALCATLAASSAPAAVQFGALSFDTSANARAQDGAVATDDYHGNAGPATTVYQPLFAQNASAAAMSGGATADATSVATVALTSPAKLRLASTIDLSLALTGVHAQGVAGGSAQVNYYFLLDQAYNFTFSNALTSTAQTDYTTFLISDLNASPMAPPAVLSSGRGARPSLSGTLAAGRYTLFLAHTSLANYTSAEMTSYAATAGNRFDFALSPLSAAPEPAAWGMLIAGFGILGAAARRRYPRAATM